VPAFKSNTAGIDLTDNVYLREMELVDRYVGSQLWVWGGAIGGQLGTGNIVHRSSPVQTIAGGNNWNYVSDSGTNDCFIAIKTDGTLWTWGVNTFGNLGDGTRTHRSSPVQTIAGGTNWKQSAGSTAIKTDGTLWIWGLNDNGFLGTGNIVHRSSPVQTIAGGNNWKQVSSGVGFAGAIKTDGTLWTWGLNNGGTLGDGTTVVRRSSPIQTIAGGNNWKQISMGFRLSAAIKTDGTLWTWGRNYNGALGDGTITHRSSPIQTIAGGTNWKQVSAGTRNYMAAIKTDGTLWTWGINSVGQLGDGTTINKSSPIQTISGGANWKQISSGQYTVRAIKTDGTLWTWGWNSYGQLAIENLTHMSSPVQTVAGGNNWKQVGSSDNSGFGITFMES